MGIKGVVGLMLASVLLVGCQSTQQRIEEDGAVRLSRAQVESLLSGKTERWSKGAGYFAPDGTLEARWQGEDVTGKWHATDDGEVCYEVDAWGQTPCTSYYEHDGRLVSVYENRLEEASDEDYREGKQLEAF